MIKIAFAGFRHGHINTLYKLAEANPDVEIVAAYEADANARANAEKTLGVRFTHENYEDMLKDENIDVVATVTTMVFEVFSYCCLESRKTCLCR